MSTTFSNRTVEPTDDQRIVTVTVNGVERRGIAEPRTLLVDFLRHELDLTGTHVGCEHGVCGACTVRLNGEVVRSCIMLAVQADGHEVTTVEALNVATGELHPIQAAFVESGALQSGYSAGAMVLAAKALLERTPDPSEWEIRDALSGILDRETGYVKVVDAVQRAAALLRGEKPEPMAPVIVERLTEHPTSVSALAAPLDMSLAAVLQHVRVLEDCGLVSTTKIGRTRTCTLAPAVLATATDWLTERRRTWETHFDRLGTFLTADPTSER